VRVKELAPQELYRRVDPDRFGFATTDEVEPLDEVLGQPRAVAAAEFGIGIERQGFNLFAMGPAGTGRHSIARQFLDAAAARRPPPADWCYVHNFPEPHRPRALELPAGRGVELRRDLEALVEELRTALPAAFESEEYQARRQVLEEEVKDQQGRAFGELQEEAKKRGLTVVQTPVGMVFAPVKEGEVLSPDDFRKLPEEERQKLEAEVESLQEELARILRQVPRWQRRRRDKLRELNGEVTHYAVGPLIAELKKKYEGLDAVLRHLAAVEEDVVQHARDFIAGGEEGGQGPQAILGADGPGVGGDRLRRYRVNVLVDRSGAVGAPVVYEDNPTYQNLIGRVEHLSVMGALVTDFNLIKAGALHRANGGYLMLDALKLLQQPFAWEGLKRALTAGEATVESLAQALSLVSTISLEPEPIPLAVKVVLVGDRMLYYLLSAYDPDFDKLFKVAADFEDSLTASDGNVDLYARFLAKLIRGEGLRPFDRGGVARVLEHCARMVEDRQRVTLRSRAVLDLLAEADHWAAQAGRGAVTAADVEEAVAAQVYRADRYRERLQEEIQRGTLLVSTAGEAVGQINGLSVLALGGFAFGRPSRITSRVRLGKGEVIDIEREVKLAGPLHSKGVLILSGFLGQRYAAEQPLSLAATLVLEQSYGGIEGDSASMAELCALLSAVAEVPIRQSLAITGSVNQHGEAQAIGGVNEKIEGFFDVCLPRGLSGEQGVVIPAANAQHLMLRRDVVEAVAAGRFHVWTVATVDEALELLTGLPAGARDGEGAYPEGSFNQRVEARLAALTAKAQSLAREASGKGEEG
jgi:lon-related putative ATP-dependent protease